MLHFLGLRNSILKFPQRTLQNSVYRASEPVSFFLKWNNKVMIKWTDLKNNQSQMQRTSISQHFCGDELPKRSHRTFINYVFHRLNTSSTVWGVINDPFWPYSNGNIWPYKAKFIRSYPARSTVQIHLYVLVKGKKCQFLHSIHGQF